MITRLYLAASECPLFLALRAGRQRAFQRRYFSAKAIYRSFPSTLHYYSPRRTSSLYDSREENKRPYDIVDEELKLSQNGFVYPAVKATSVSNGATLFPNTFMFQELVRGYLDEKLDREDEGQYTEASYIYTFRKGTQLPVDLTLMNDYISKFSLQPSRGMLPGELNKILDDFYDKYAHKETAESWIVRHPYGDAIPDDADSVWLAK